MRVTRSAAATTSPSTSSTAGPSGRLKKIDSDAAATSATEPATRAPAGARAALPALSKTTRSAPERARFAAIGPPILPRPTNPYARLGAHAVSPGSIPSSRSTSRARRNASTPAGMPQ